MKRTVTLLCLLCLLFGVLPGCNFEIPDISLPDAVATEAAADENAIEVSAGDTVSYVLTLGNVPEGVVGCDFSFYYDDTVFSVDSVADFTNSTDSEEWKATISTDHTGEVRGLWSILQGVDFSTARPMITVNLKAKQNGASHLTYFVRYLYDYDLQEFTQYKFTCDVKKNGTLILDDAQPELDLKVEQTTGSFVNSLTGDSSDADPSIPGTVGESQN